MGVAISGYSKVELVARALSASEMNLQLLCQVVHKKQSLIKDFNKWLQEYRLTDLLKF